MEEKGPDALEMAAQAHEEGEAQAPEEVVLITVKLLELYLKEP